MLEREFERIYFRFRLLHYRELFSPRCAKDGSLSANEACSAEVIFLLDHPTIKEFANFLKISQPNATYKVNNLVAKGYVTKTVSEGDKRECRLGLSEKFYSYYNASTQFIDRAVESLQEQFSPEELRLFGKMLGALAQAVE